MEQLERRNNSAVKRCRLLSTSTSIWEGEDRFLPNKAKKYFVFSAGRRGIHVPPWGCRGSGRPAAIPDCESGGAGGCGTGCEAPHPGTLSVGADRGGDRARLFRDDGVGVARDPGSKADWARGSGCSGGAAKGGVKPAASSPREMI